MKLTHAAMAAFAAVMATGRVAPAEAQSAKRPTAAAKPAKPAASTKSAPKSAPKAATGKTTVSYRGVPDKPDAATSHEVLLMAFRDNLVTLTKTLRGQGSGSAPVNVNVARPALAEIQRAYEQIMKHNEAQMEELGGTIDASTKAMTASRDARLGRIGKAISALDLVVNDPTPDPKEVALHSAAILRECAALTPLRAKATR